MLWCVCFHVVWWVWWGGVGDMDTETLQLVDAFIDTAVV